MILTRFARAYLEAVTETHLIMVGELLYRISPFSREVVVIEDGVWK